MIPTYYYHGITRDVNSYELCGFCDATMSAYAAVIYLVARTTMGEFIRFITSKSRVALT